MKVHVQKMVKITLALLSVIQLKEEELLSMLQLLFNNSASTILMSGISNNPKIANMYDGVEVGEIDRTPL